jgi:hypothetical protein
VTALHDAIKNLDEAQISSDHQTKETGFEIPRTEKKILLNVPGWFTPVLWPPRRQVFNPSCMALRTSLGSFGAIVLAAISLTSQMSGSSN